ncbi:hypothetical protein [Furfurilactobacillus siliginis]|nr:hypothetical protein [Furfurilactobacillus siliginis]GEK27871.1 hypothetical protein LSI01_01820 [Furfurilactobacillus siliginis]
MGEQFRDLTIVPLSSTIEMVIACDSSAGIGEKKADMVAIDTATMSAYSLRVPLLELLAYGAKPVSVVDTVGNEMEPTGAAVIKGMRAEMQRADLSDIPLNGSTEDNMVTQTTSVGVTVIGIRDRSPKFSKQTAMAVYCLGTPYVGEEVKKHLDEIFGYQELRQIQQTTGVVDILPVGSKGMAFEVEQLRQTHHLNQVIHASDWKLLDMEKSAGPATVLLIAVDKRKQIQFEKENVLPVKRLCDLEGAAI